MRPGKKDHNILGLIFGAYVYVGTYVLTLVPAHTSPYASVWGLGHRASNLSGQSEPDFKPFSILPDGKALL